MIPIDNIGIFLSSPEGIFKNYNKDYLISPSIFTKEIFLIFSCVLNVFEIFSILELKTLKLIISGISNNMNVKKRKKDMFLPLREIRSPRRHRSILIRICCHCILRIREIPKGASPTLAHFYAHPLAHITST